MSKNMIVLDDLPILPKTITIPSKTRTIPGISGKPEAATYTFVRGVPKQIDDAEDREMLLGLTTPRTGYGGQGIAQGPMFKVASAQEQIARMHQTEKVDRLLMLLEKRAQSKGLTTEELLLGDDEETPAPAAAVKDDAEAVMEEIEDL